MNFDIFSALKTAQKEIGADVHISVGSTPMCGVGGVEIRMSDYAPTPANHYAFILDADDLKSDVMCIAFNARFRAAIRSLKDAKNPELMEQDK